MEDKSRVEAIQEIKKITPEVTILVFLSEPKVHLPSDCCIGPSFTNDVTPLRVFLQPLGRGRISAIYLLLPGTPKNYDKVFIYSTWIHATSKAQAQDVTLE